MEDYSAIAVTALDNSKWDPLDGINEDNESARIAASSGVKALQSLVSIGEVNDRFHFSTDDDKILFFIYRKSTTSMLMTWDQQQQLRKDQFYPTLNFSLIKLRKLNFQTSMPSLRVQNGIKELPLLKLKTFAERSWTHQQI